MYTDKCEKGVLQQTETMLKAGFELVEQEKYKLMLKKVIEDTESHKIKTTEEIIQRLVYELTSSNVLKENF